MSALHMATKQALAKFLGFVSFNLDLGDFALNKQTGFQYFKKWYSPLLSKAWRQLFLTPVYMELLIYKSDLRVIFKFSNLSVD